MKGKPHQFRKGRKVGPAKNESDDAIESVSKAAVKLSAGPDTILQPKKKEAIEPITMHLNSEATKVEEHNPLTTVENYTKEKINESIKSKGSSAYQQNEAYINQEILSDVIELVREANDKIQQVRDKGILLMGKTGAGKSTLATIMAGRPLQAITDDEEGRLILDALEPLEDIIISNSKVAETRIPNKCYAEDIVIWDCPGFHDNRGIAQEIANGFYIKRLLETTRAVKFVLVIPESALDSNRGVDFIDTVNQLIRSFTDVTIIDGCISLMVTSVTQGRQPVHILKSIERITNQNRLLNSDTVEAIKYLKQSVHVFHKPNVEGELKVKYEFLTAINNGTNYAINIADYARISISDASMSYAKYILKTAQNKFSEIVGIILKTAAESHGSFDQNSQLTNSYKIIEKLLPNSITQRPLKYSPECKDSKNTKHFADIAAWSHLHDVVNVSPTISMANTDAVLGFLNNILKAYEEYIGSGNRQQELLKSQIHGYTCVINQQMEYIKFFSKLCDQEILGYLNTLKQPIALCKEAVSKNLETEIKSIVVVPNHTDPEYYKTALKYLELYHGQEWSTKTQAKVHIYLADLSESNEAVVHCLTSINLDKTLPLTYNKLGDLLFKEHAYKAAIGCYKIINNSNKVQKCYKELLKLNPENPQLTLEAADYLASKNIYSKAIELYNDVFSFSLSQQDDSFRIIAWNRISHVMDGMHEKAVELTQKAEAHDFYNFDSIDVNALQTLIGDHFDYHS